MGIFEFLSQYRNARMTAEHWARHMGIVTHHDTDLNGETMEQFIMREKYERGLTTQADPESAG